MLKRVLVTSLTFFVTIIGLILSIDNASAAGYSSDLYSASALGNVYSGAVNGAHDISNIFHNPALGVKFKREMVISASYINLDIDNDNASGAFSGGAQVTGSDEGDAGVDGIIPSFYITSPINDKTSINLSVNVPFGLATKYDKEWVGRYRAIESEIMNLNINPSISYKVNDKLALGAGLQIGYLKTSLTQMFYTGGNDAFAKMHGSDFGYGYNLGLNYKIKENLNFGLAYRSKIDYKITGNADVKDFALSSNFNAKTTTPESVTFGLAYNPKERIELLYDSTWMRWSRLKKLSAIADNSALNNQINFNFRDSWIHSLGLNYQLNEEIKLRTGFAYEKDAVNNSAREPRIPTGNRIWAAFGLNYKILDNSFVDLSYVRQFYQRERINLSDSTTQINSLSATTKTYVNVFSLGFRQQF